MSEIFFVTKFFHSKLKGSWNLNLKMTIVHKNVNFVIIWAISDSDFSTKNE